MNNRTIQNAIASLVLIEEAVVKQFGYEDIHQLNPVMTVEFQTRVNQVVALTTAEDQKHHLDGMSSAIDGLRRAENL